jgi:hypothetical protein
MCADVGMKRTFIFTLTEGRTMSQNEQIRAALLAGRTLTPLDALTEFGCFRLAARVADLRRSGLDIECQTETQNGKRYARYALRAPHAIS